MAGNFLPRDQVRERERAKEKARLEQEDRQDTYKGVLALGFSFHPTSSVRVCVKERDRQRKKHRESESTPTVRG